LGLIKLLDRIAGHQSRSEEELATEALREYLRFEAEQIPKVTEGISAADRSDFATDEEVAAFFARYDEAQ
jgi:predicted transcriptional regulator